MSVVFASLVPVFGLIVLGYCLKRLEVVPEDNWRGVEKLGYWVFFPSLLTTTMANADLSSIELSTVVLTMGGAFMTMTIALLVLRKALLSAFAINNASFTSIFQCSTRWNGFTALPIAIDLYGDLGLALVAVIMALLVPMSNAINIAVLARYAAVAEPPGVARIVQIVFRNPFIWATIVGMSINLLHIRVHPVLMTTMDILGGAALATGLLMVGAGLMLRYTLPPTMPAVFGTLTKLVAMPALVAAWGWVFGLDGAVFVVAIICASVPTAMNGYLLARQMGGDAPLQAAATTLQTALSFLTIPLMILMAQML